MSGPPNESHVPPKRGPTPERTHAMGGGKVTLFCHVRGVGLHPDPPSILPSSRRRRGRVVVGHHRMLFRRTHCSNVSSCVDAEKRQYQKQACHRASIDADIAPWRKRNLRS